MMPRKTSLTIPILAIFMTLLPKAFGQSVILGVLEDNSGHYAGEPNSRTVRALFKKDRSDWQPFPSDCEDTVCLKSLTATYPPEVTWTITFDGRNLGQVTGRTPKDFAWYSSVGQQEITSKGPVPTVGERSEKFGGYTGAAVYRPLVANSQPNFNDPDGWKLSAPFPNLQAILRSAFRGKFPRLCHSNSTDDSAKPEPFPYRDEEMNFVKAYRSKTGWIAVQMHIDATDCEDAEAGFGIDDAWFVVSPRHSVTYLDSGIWLVDAGDYDHDGRSELVFSIDKDNRGGYEIFYDEFKKHAKSEFSYH